MTEIEFVNRELAEAEAARAIDLLNRADGVRVEAWFAMQAVADQIGPTSNVGVKGISWAAGRAGRRGQYSIQATCIDGERRTSTGAPPTLEEARHPEHLSKAQRILDRLVDEGGGLVKSRRSRGTSTALVEAVAHAPAGRAWLDAHTDRAARAQLLAMVRVADAYGRDGICPHASLDAHVAFLAFPNRSELIRQFPTQGPAWGKAMSLRRGTEYAARPALRKLNISPSQVTRLAVRTGVTTQEARVILRAVMDGRSKAKLVRAVNEAVKIAEADGQRLKVAA